MWQHDESAGMSSCWRYSACWKAHAHENLHVDLWLEEKSMEVDRAQPELVITLVPAPPPPPVLGVKVASTHN